MKMPNYRRSGMHGGTFFITQVTYQRQPWLCTEIGRTALRHALGHVRQSHPFDIDAFVLLPDHFHCVWTLPHNDGDLSKRMRLVKRVVTKYYGHALGLSADVSASREKRKEGNVWQRRFWEHLIRDESDFAAHCDYIHYNPVRHGLCDTPQQWPFSSLHRLTKKGVYSPDWGGEEIKSLEYINLGNE
nr:transposase [Nodosilinea sp. TSF1-S3]